MVFVSEARRILSYFHLTEDRRPPKSIWHSPKKCDKWIEDHDPFDKDKQADNGQLSFDDWETE